MTDRLVVYGSRPAWGTPDFSPFVIKLETWLRLAGVPYERRDQGNPWMAPKGKIPYVDLDGERLGDSQLILEAVTARRGVTLDHWLTPEQAARGRAIRRMLEEGTYFLTLRLRWLEDDGWAVQRIAFRAVMPPGLGPLILPMVRRNVRRMAQAQGAGRHRRDEAIAMAVADLDAVETLLGDQPFLLGDRPSTVDATAYAFLVAIQNHPGTTPFHERSRAPRLLAYTARIGAAYWPPTELSTR